MCVYNAQLTHSSLDKIVAADNIFKCIFLKKNSQESN